MRFKNPEKTIKITITALAIYLIAFGIAMAFFPIRPFWNDEWRLIYNLKFKTAPQLWGRLDLLQECPRLYLTVLKQISSFFDYSYISLRTPALVLCILNILFLFSLRKKLFASNNIYSYLFVFIILSSQTLTDYIVQVKQYEMDIFTTLLALWQLLLLLKLGEEGWQGNKNNYLLLCLSCLFIPFFSYTYPIAIAPVFPILILKAFLQKQRQEGENRRISLLSLFLPLLIVSISIIIFYIVDVRRLMADKSMYQSYLHMQGNDKGEKHYLSDIWNLFALVGSGYIYEIVFGILGILSFLYGIYRLAVINKRTFTQEDYLQLYAILLLLITLFLFLSGKLLGGVARLTAYTVPSIAILIVTMLSKLRLTRYTWLPDIAALALFLGLTGNIISCCIGNFTYPEYHNRVMTYLRTSKALKEARQEKIPLMYTTAVDGDVRNDTALAPGSIKTNTITPEQIAGADVLCGEVILKVNPEYKVWDPIPVYEIPDTKWLNSYLYQLPPQYRAAIAGDGINFTKLRRQE